jgi:hypothetical protein
MPPQHIPHRKIKRILVLHAIQGINKSEIARSLSLSRNTVREYVKLYEDSDVCCTDIMALPAKTLAKSFIGGLVALKNERRMSLENHLRAFQDELIKPEMTLMEVWEEYRQREPLAYRYSQFVSLYHRWRDG